MNSPLPASTRASHASANTAGKPARNAPAFPPMSRTPAAAPAARGIHSAFERFGQANPFAGVAADLGGEGAGDRIAARNLGELPRGGFDGLAVIAQERLPQGCRGGRRLEGRAPIRRPRRDLAVGGPAERWDELPEIDRLAVEKDKRRQDDEKPEVDRDPVLGAPGGWRRDADRRRCGLRYSVRHGGKHFSPARRRRPIPNRYKEIKSPAYAGLKGPATGDSGD